MGRANLYELIGEDFGDYDGGQAEYIRVPYGNVGPIKVSEEYSDDQVFF